MLESKTERDTCALAEAEGVPNIKLKTKGYNDRLFFIPGGRPLLIEFKRLGEPPRALQEYIHNKLKRLGYDVEVHTDTEEAINSIRTAKRRALDAKKNSQKRCEVPAAKRSRRTILGPRRG